MRISDWSSDVCSSDLAKKLGMVAQFHEVIRGRCGGRGEPERNGLAGLDQLGAVMPIGRFKDAALIQNDRAELRQVEMIQLLIVGNTDAFAIAKMRRDAELLSLAHHLR